MSVAHILSWLTETPAEPVFFLVPVALWFGELFVALLCAFACVTLTFGILEYSGTTMPAQSVDLDDLPQLPREEAAKPWEAIAGMVCTTLFTAAFLSIPEIIGGYFEPVGWVPLLEKAAIHSVWYLIALVGALSVTKDFFRLKDGNAPARVVAVTIIANVLELPLLYFFVRRGVVVNPAFMEQMHNHFAGEGAFIVTAAQYCGNIFLAVAAFALLLDTGKVLYRAEKCRRAKTNG